MMIRLSSPYIFFSAFQENSIHVSTVAAQLPTSVPAFVTSCFLDDGHSDGGKVESQSSRGVHINNDS